MSEIETRKSKTEGISRAAFFALLLLSVFRFPISAFAQEDAELPPPPKRPGVQITFIPPTLKGTLSLGIFNKAGKLIRTLHREATTKDFVVGLNGLITWWDGKDDAGAVAPIGKYFARGFAVGSVEIEGIAFHFNDWIDDEKSPRIRRIADVRAEGGGLRLIGALADGRCVTFAADAMGKMSDAQPFGRVEHFAHPMNVLLDQMPADSMWKPIREAAEQFAGAPVIALDGLETILASADGRLLLREKNAWRWLDIDAAKRPAYACLGRAGSLWTIVRAESGAEVRQDSFEGEFLRRLAIEPGDPVPVRIAAAPESDVVALIEESPGIQRVRQLTLATDESARDESRASSTWKVTFSKTIRQSDKLEDVQVNLKNEAGEPFIAIENFNVRLLPNPLVQNKITSVDVGVGFDARGSFLRTADGLPLKRVTETPGLKWVAMMKDTADRGVTIFQSDGAVVEEFRARRLANMMAFDAGDYEWAGK